MGLAGKENKEEEKFRLEREEGEENEGEREGHTQGLKPGSCQTDTGVSRKVRHTEGKRSEEL